MERKKDKYIDRTGLDKRSDSTNYIDRDYSSNLLDSYSSSERTKKTPCRTSNMIIHTVDENGLVDFPRKIEAKLALNGYKRWKG